MATIAIIVAVLLMAVLALRYRTEVLAFVRIAPGAAAPAPGTLITPWESLKRVGIISAITGFAVAIPFAAVIAFYFSATIALIVLIVVGGNVIRVIMRESSNAANEVPLGSEGVSTRFGKPDGALLTAGIHPRIPGIEGSVPVEMREYPVNPEPFFDLAGGDNLKVETNAFFTRRTVNPVLSLTEVKAIDTLLDLEFKSVIRFFVNQLKRAEDSVDLKDDVKDWVNLPIDDGTLESAERHAQLYNSLYDDKDKFVDGEHSVQIIADRAGQFLSYALARGVQITGADVEYFDIPKSRREAALAKANQADEMAAKIEQNLAIKKMVDDQVASGINIKDALTSVEMQMGLATTRKVDETVFGIKDLDANAAINGVLKPVADALARKIGGEPPPAPKPTFEARKPTVNNNRPVRR